MIRTIRGKLTQDIFDSVNSKETRKFPNELITVARRKLDMISKAHFLEDLAVPPSNRLEKLKGNMKSYHSIRINDQYRVIFKWDSGYANDVEIVDYH